jgi:ligand-binding sensor domain-containing protein
MRKVVFIFAIIIVASSVQVGYAQMPFLHQYHLLRKNQPVQINEIFQDRSGFIWLGTTAGLFRFDGVKYQRFAVQDSLSENHITALAEDSVGRIWVGHNNGNISILEKGTIRKFEPNEGSAAAPVSKIWFDAKGTLWFSTLNDGLYYYLHERLYRLDDEEGLPDLYVYDIAEDNTGNIWAGTDAGAVICTLKDRKVSVQVIDYKKGLPDNIIKKIFCSGDEVWMATEDAGIVFYNSRSQKIERLIEQWHYGAVFDFFLKGDKVWIATQQGVIVYDKKKRTTRQYQIRAQGGNSLTALLKDSEGNVWIGTRSTLFRTPGDELEFIEDVGTAENPSLLAVTPDKSGRIWFSNNKGLFTHETDRSGQVKITDWLKNTSFNKKVVISLYCDHDGYIWAGLYGDGVLRINPADGKIKLLNKELRNGNVLSITGRHDVIWLATLGGASKIIVNGEKLNVTNYSSNDGLSSDFVYQVFIDSKERIWFATDGKGVNMLDEKGFHHYDKGLQSKVIYGFAEDASQQLWVNVQGSGLHTFNEDQFVPLSKTILIRDNNIQSIAADKDGNIVVMHDLGMDVINVKSKSVRYLGDEAGMRDKIVTLNGFGKDDAGNLYFASTGGLIKYAGGNDFASSLPNPVVVDVQVSGQRFDKSAALKLSHDENNMTIRYRGLWYQNPEGVSYQYKLDNYDVDWITTREQFVTYSKLPPGQYVFKLRASGSENFNGARETSFSFVISPPFWRTNAFYVASAAAVLIIVFLFIKFRERKLRYDKFVLEMKVRRRTLEIQRQKEEIQAQNEEIMAQAEEINGINENLEMLVRERTSELELKNKALEEYAFINAHKLRSPLASILGLVHLLLKTELTEEGKEIGKHLQQSADELDDVVHSITKTIERADKDHPLSKNL